MYINYNGSEIIYGELISGRAAAIFVAALKKMEIDEMVFCFLQLECSPALTFTFLLWL